MKKVLFILFLLFTTPLFAKNKMLKYPSDCKDRTLQKSAKKNQCSLIDGGNHWRVFKKGKMITTIPYSVKDNKTCKNVIQILNAECL